MGGFLFFPLPLRERNKERGISRGGFARGFEPGSRTRRRGTFLSRQENTQRRAPPARATPSSVPHPTGRSTNSPGANYAPRARTRSRLKTPGGAAVLGACYGVV